MHKSLFVIAIFAIHSAAALAQTASRSAQPARSGAPSQAIQAGSTAQGNAIRTNQGDGSSALGNTAGTPTAPVPTTSTRGIANAASQGQDISAPGGSLNNPVSQNPARRNLPTDDAMAASGLQTGQTVGGVGGGAAAASFRGEFDAMDSDGDGSISWDEYSRSGNTVGFTSLDSNGDLKISPAEWRNYLRRRAQE